MNAGKNVINMVLGLILLQISGCTSNEVVLFNKTTDTNGKPQWVSQGTVTLKSKRGRTFLAVGAASTQGAFSAQASVANQRAKLQAELILKRFFDVVSRDYIATGAAEIAGYTVQDVPQNVSKTTAVILPYMQIKEHWHDVENNMIYAITGIDYRQVVERVSEAVLINAGFKAYLKAQGNDIFDRIAIQR
ncbi:MAG: hypothetical protein GXP08_14725 [Gammaproteobacteria bacterium]|nr:hypothetical protein [Gammaproteobacteria bacterium]